MRSKLRTTNEVGPIAAVEFERLHLSENRGASGEESLLFDPFRSPKH